MRRIHTFFQFFLFGTILYGLVVVLPARAAQVLTHGPANNAPDPAQIQSFCSRYTQAKPEYKKQYRVQYRQYCAARLPLTAKPAGPKLSVTTTIRLKKPRIKQLWLPKCVEKGSRIRVTGEQFNAGQVTCVMQPALALGTATQSANSLQLLVSGIPRAGTAYALRCRAGSQSINSRQVNACRKQPVVLQPAASPVVVTKPRLPVDLTGTLELLLPLGDEEGAQQRVKVQYRNLGQGQARGMFDMEIFVAARKVGSQKVLPAMDGKHIVLSRIAGNTVPAGGMQQVKFVSVRLPAGFVAGSYTWCVRLDTRHQISERNENNNTYCIRPSESLSGTRLRESGVAGVFGAKLRSRPVTGADGKTLPRLETVRNRRTIERRRAFARFPLSVNGDGGVISDVTVNGYAFTISWDLRGMNRILSPFFFNLVVSNASAIVGQELCSNVSPHTLPGIYGDGEFLGEVRGSRWVRFTSSAPTPIRGPWKVQLCLQRRHVNYSYDFFSFQRSVLVGNDRRFVAPDDYFVAPDDYVDRSFMPTPIPIGGDPRFENGTALPDGEVHIVASGVASRDAETDPRVVGASLVGDGLVSFRTRFFKVGYRKGVLPIYGDTPGSRDDYVYVLVLGSRIPACNITVPQRPLLVDYITEVAGVAADQAEISGDGLQTSRFPSPHGRTWFARIAVPPVGLVYYYTRLYVLGRFPPESGRTGHAVVCSNVVEVKINTGG